MENLERHSCRLCNYDKLRSILTIGNHLVNDFPTYWGSYKGHRCPLELVECQLCGLIQLRHSAPNELLYTRHYWYKSANSPIIKADLQNTAEKAVNILKKKTGNILDIGANDGSLLSYFPRGFTRFACEPARNLKDSLKKHADYILDDYWSFDKIKDFHPTRKSVINLNPYDGKFQIITAIGMFYDLEDPKKFMHDVAKALDDNGIFIAQLMTAKQMIKKNDVGNICHEHLEYYTWKSLRYLFGTVGLEIFKIQENDINGGSYRIFARHWRDGHVDYKEPKLDFEKFKEKIQANRARCLKFIDERIKAGNNVYVYGASTKGNTILQYYGLGPDRITAAVEKDFSKIGKHTITGIPIVQQSKVRRKADYYLCLPYAFLKHFKKIEKADGFKGKWIIISPNFQVL